MGIKRFEKEVKNELGYYVYRLVDPRNGNTFYVGKGKGDRIFEHEKYAIGIIGKDKSNLFKNEDDESLKVKIIREIYDDGLIPIHIIQKFGLTEKEAFLIELSLIDVYSLNSLSNIQNGHFSDNGPDSAESLNTTLALEEYKETKNTPPYIIIKIKDSMVQKKGNRYEATRSAWKMKIERAKKYQYVLSVTNGIVKEVYKVNNWEESKTLEGRIIFDGEIAEKKVKSLFINKKIPSKYRKKGDANPIKYSK